MMQIIIDLLGHQYPCPWKEITSPACGHLEALFILPRVFSEHLWCREHVGDDDNVDDTIDDDDNLDHHADSNVAFDDDDNNNDDGVVTWTLVLFLYDGWL